MESVNVRDLDQIQESDGAARVNRLTTVFLTSLGGAALVIAGVMTMDRNAPPATSMEDPLAALVAKAQKADSQDVVSIDRRDVTFTGVLSDAEESTTALVAVKDPRGRLIAQGSESIDGPSVDMAVVEALPTVPLPAGELLGASSLIRHPKDDMTALASQVSEPERPDEHVMPGGEGGYQLQVASFQELAEADRFVADLRKRGHRAYRQAAYVADRGLWHRVRIGPFKSRYSADLYRKDFEKSERMSTFVVDTEKVKRQEQVRRAKEAERKKEG
jgi:DedD protein